MRSNYLKESITNFSRLSQTKIKRWEQKIETIKVEADGDKVMVFKTFRLT